MPENVWWSSRIVKQSPGDASVVPSGVIPSPVTYLLWRRQTDSGYQANTSLEYK